jgi:hypothetical protein
VIRTRPIDVTDLPQSIEEAQRKFSLMTSTRETDFVLREDTVLDHLFSLAARYRAYLSLPYMCRLYEKKFVQIPNHTSEEEAHKIEHTQAVLKASDMMILMDAVS